MVNQDVKGRIDNAVRCLKPFFDNQLSTLDAQIEGDKEYIRAMCNLRDMKSDPYVKYYEKRIEEEYKK